MPAPIELEPGAYETVAASQTAQVLGAPAPRRSHPGLLVIPATTSPGNVALLDSPPRSPCSPAAHQRVEPGAVLHPPRAAQRERAVEGDDRGERLGGRVGSFT